MIEPPRRPLLLVSVRNAHEAHAALEGGADVIDIKEPSNGPLGRASDADIREVLQVVREISEQTPVSAACGEVCDLGAEVSVPLPAGLTYAKLGLSELADDKKWYRRWCDVRSALSPTQTPPPRWIAVIYADAETARVPEPIEVIDAALHTGCTGVLVDTYSKQGPHLTELMYRSKLALFSGLCHELGLMFAVAGRLTLGDLSKLPEDIDIVAVRSAACREGDRLQPVCADRVAELREALDVRHRAAVRTAARSSRPDDLPAD